MSDPVPQARPSFGARLASAAGRRCRYVWSRLARGHRPPPVEAALDWLCRQEIDGGLRDPSQASCVSPALTGACIETAVSYGCRAEAARWARWLVSVQGEDGSFPRAVLLDGDLAEAPAESYERLTGLLKYVQSPTFESTGWAVRGFLAAACQLPEVEAPARRAWRYLSRWVDDRGQLRPPAEGHRLAASLSNWPILPLLPAFKKAALRWGDPLSGAAAERALRAAVESGLEPGCGSAAGASDSSGHVAQQVEMLMDAGKKDEALRLIGRTSRCQIADGSVREWLPKALFDPVLTLGRTIAHAAVLWYRLGDRERADRAMQYLERRQWRDGSLPHRPRRWIPAWRGRNGWATKHYLDAALLRVRAAFDNRWPDFPERIDPADGRMQAVRQWCDTLPPGATVADVGCGKGRFLKHLAAWFPDARLVGIDISPAMLAQLPQGVEAREGSILRIPAADGEFDGALAIESLEHSLVPERAVAEICRIVRPGGRVLVIDKHRARQRLSEHDPWERWFLPEELRCWLGRHCDAVSVQPVSHSEGRGGTGLFLAAGGIRRGGCAGYAVDPARLE